MSSLSVFILAFYTVVCTENKFIFIVFSLSIVGAKRISSYSIKSLDDLTFQASMYILLVSSFCPYLYSRSDLRLIVTRAVGKVEAFDFARGVILNIKFCSNKCVFGKARQPDWNALLHSKL